MLAHRQAWLFSGREIAHGLQLLHRCDVRNCVNPQHLFLGTQADNIADMDAKGRRGIAPQPGESNPMAKGTDALVMTIRRAYAAGGVTQHQLARKFNVTRAFVCDVVRGKSWKHLPLR